jgi:hypothetical protein
MHNDNYACFDCRIAFKNTLYCPLCKQEMTLLSHKIRVPKKKDEKGWLKLEFLLRSWGRQIRKGDK